MLKMCGGDGWARKDRLTICSGKEDAQRRMYNKEAHVYYHKVSDLSQQCM